MKFFRRNKDELSREELIRRIQQSPMPSLAPPAPTYSSPPRIDMSFLTSGPYPPIQFRPPSMSPLLRMMLEHAEERPQVDCVRDVWEDREKTEGYLYNAYVSDRHEDGTHGPFYSGVLTSAVTGFADPDLDNLPISVCVANNIGGSTRAINTYLSIENAQQLANQLMHAISVAEARTNTEA